MKTDRRLSNATALLKELSNKELEGTIDFNEVIMVAFLSVFEDIHWQLLCINRNMEKNIGVKNGNKNI